MTRALDLFGEAAAAKVAAIAPAIGPVVVVFMGYNIPVLSASLALVGVMLAALIAPPPPRPLTLVQRIALMLLLALLAVALAIGATSSPVVSLVWAIGIGYSGLPLIAEIQRLVFARTGELAGRVSPVPSETIPPATSSPDAEPSS